MNLIWINANDWTYFSIFLQIRNVGSRSVARPTILLMPFFKLEYKLASFEYIKIGLVPACRRREFGPWEMCQRTKIKSIHNKTKQVDEIA